jgi:hypothetical protein
MPVAGFEHIIPASKQPQHDALECLATGIGRNKLLLDINTVI